MRRPGLGTLLAIVIVSALSFMAPPRAAEAASEDRSARIELTTTATLYGVGLGVYTSMWADLSPRPAAWASAALGGGMLYGTYTLADRLDLRAGEIRYVESSAAWLAIDTALLEAALEIEGDAIVWSAFGAAALGAGTALATRGMVGASAGQVSLVNSGGLYGPVAGVLLGITFHLWDGEHLFRDLLVLNLAGLGTGIGLAQEFDPTRQQVHYMDGGILLGGLIGGLVGTLVGVGFGAHEAISGLALAGMGVGGYLAVHSYGFDRSGARRAAKAESASEALKPVMFTLAAGRF